MHRSRSAHVGFAHLGVAGRCIALLGIGVAGAGALLWSHPDRPSAELQQRMSGRFVLDEPLSEIEKRLGQAVERVVEPLDGPARSILQAQLLQVVSYCHGYRFDFESEHVRVQCDGDSDVRHRFDEAGPTLDRKSRVLDIDVEEDGIVVSAGAQSGAHTTSYRLEDDGRLEVDVRVTSEQLDRPLAWTLRYRRADRDLDRSPRTPAVAATR